MPGASLPPATCRVYLLAEHELIRAGEHPSSGDAQNVDIFRDVGREHRVWFAETHNTFGRLIKHFLARGMVDFYFLDAAIGAYRYRELQVAIDFLLPCRLRVVECTDAFDLEAPILDITRETVFLSSRTDEFTARPLLIRHLLLLNLCLKPYHFEAAVQQIHSIGYGFRVILRLRMVIGKWHRGARFDLRQQFP